MNNAERGFCRQTCDFICGIGLYSKIVILTCVAINIMQVTHYDGMTSNDYSFNYYDVVENGEYFRIFTAALTHYGILHILFNMCWTAMFGYTMERQYGTIFMFALAFWIQLLGMLMHIGYIYMRLQFQAGHAEYLARVNYAGYSVVLFGLIMLQCTQGGNPYTNLYGCSIRRVYLPFVYLIASQIITNNQADIVGHITGIIAALSLKYMFMYEMCVLPRYSVVKLFDDCLRKVSCRFFEYVLAYYPATE